MDNRDEGNAMDGWGNAWGIRVRREFRRFPDQFLNQPVQVRGVGIAAAVLLLASLLSLGGIDSGSTQVSAGGEDEPSGDLVTPSEDRSPAEPADDAPTPSSEEAQGAGDETVASDPVAEPSGTTAPTGTGGGAVADRSATPPGACGDNPPPASPGARSDSDRGVSEDAIKVVFPVFDPAAAFQLVGAGANIETAEKMIRACVDHVNANGGIDGRAIDAMIPTFNPLEESSMRAQCIRWATDDRVFAVVDSDAWHTSGQLCLTEEHETPLVSRWTTASEWTERGAPYLWWTAPSADDTIANWVLWAREAGHLGGSNVVGVVIADRESDTFAKNLIEDALGRVGVDPHLEVIPYNDSQAQAALPGAIQRLKAAQVNKLFVLLPFTTYSHYLTHADQQSFYPQLLVSDYEAVVVVSDALLGENNRPAIDGAEGTTHNELGIVNDGTNFRAAPQRCNDIHMEAHPDHGPGHIDIAGVAMRWCDNITVLVEAARRASVASNGELTRIGFTEAMATLESFPGRMTPNLAFGPGDYSGPDRSKTVRIRTEEDVCPPELDDPNEGDRDDVCTFEIDPYQVFRRF